MAARLDFSNATDQREDANGQGMARMVLAMGARSRMNQRDLAIEAVRRAFQDEIQCLFQSAVLNITAGQADEEVKTKLNNGINIARKALVFGIDLTQNVPTWEADGK